MNIFFDTSVLIPAFVLGHPHYERALGAIRQLRGTGNHGSMSQHGIAEFYAVMTALPLVPRVHPSEALRILEENILPHCRPINLDPKDYVQLAQRMAAHDWKGGKFYDALHLRCAQKANADRIYTFNVKHFQQMAPELAGSICAP